MKFIMLMLIVSSSVFALDFHNFSEKNLVESGCKCKTQKQINSFISKGEKKRAKKLSKTGIEIGIISKNSKKAKNYKTKKRYNLENWGIDKLSYDRAVLFVNFGDEK